MIYSNRPTSLCHSLCQGKLFSVAMSTFYRNHRSSRNFDLDMLNTSNTTYIPAICPKSMANRNTWTVLRCIPRLSAIFPHIFIFDCAPAFCSLLSGATVTRTQTHTYLVNIISNTLFLTVIFTKSLWVWVWVCVTPLNCISPEQRVFIQIAFETYSILYYMSSYILS